MRVALLQQRSKQNRPVTLELSARQSLGFDHVFDPSETVLPLDVVNPRLVELAGEPMSAVDTNVDSKGEPGLQAQVRQTELLVQKIKVVVQALARFQTQHQLLLLAVASHVVTQAGFNHTPNSDEAGCEAVPAGAITGQKFLALGTALQVGQRAARMLGQSMGGAAHALSPTGGEGSKILK